MPIFEFYCPDNNRIYQFYAKTLAQAARVPKCPDNPKFRMQKLLSRFAVNTGAKEAPAESQASSAQMEDARAEATMCQIEKEFAHLEDSNPKDMGKVLRRMAELSGEKMEGPIEEAVRRLEEGQDPEEVGERMEGAEGEGPGGDAQEADSASRAKRRRLPLRRPQAIRDPRLYDYD
ncbi:MAG: FmdB family transcriptional regulator [Opitutaceae bacterium]|nr:FmdB family transcriptional regulator [Opitutaceae bacterium]